MAEAMTTGKKQAAGKSGNGRVNRLYEVAFRKLDEGAEDIGEALKNAAAQGKVMSTRLLIELAEKFADAKQGEVSRPFHALLLALAAGPEWPAEAADAVKRAGAGKTDA
jgi:hypothetical protein